MKIIAIYILLVYPPAFIAESKIAIFRYYFTEYEECMQYAYLHHEYQFNIIKECVEKEGQVLR